MKEMRYFSGDTKLAGAWSETKAKVRAKFPTGAIKRDGSNLFVGTESGLYDPINYLPVTRAIYYNVNGSNHKCDARCRCATGGNCECSCGGKFHGIDRVG